MTALIIDAGNSRLKWSVLEAGRLAPMQAQPWETLTGAPAAWRRLGPARIVAVSVAGAARDALLERWCGELWARPPRFVRTTSLACGVHNGYAEPERLGVDRWAALVGAWGAGLAPACIVDCGSAVTADVLDAEGRHRGGWIAPGLASQRAVLLRSTRALGLRGAAESDPAGGPWGASTEEAVQLGCLNAVAALAREARTLAGRLGGGPVAGLLCGGDGPAVQRLLGADWTLRPGLVLEGAARLAGEVIEEYGS